MGEKDLDFFKRTIQSNLVKAGHGAQALTFFLNAEQQALIQSAAVYYPDVSVVMDGGLIHAEYRRVLFMPKSSTLANFKIRVFEVTYAKKFLQPTHRMVLGSILSLGIKRESIGDIYITPSKDIYVAFCEEITPFLLENFKTIGHVAVELKECVSKIEIVRQKERKNVTVSSLRLDVLISAAYHVSRSQSSKLIESGLVQVNHRLALNGSLLLKESDLLSVRHYGRVTLEKIGGNTKSNRHVICLAFDC
ncbi:MAG TPA: hypothetical protein IAD46_04600 [Candidatus Pelethenecus faecipullorum]|uniref:RNA-binding S4 domain-containing protein n=1 Tax=Candidatus Pelethenecus faecipullorum TaxID=2840900 RepID=A0A9D1GRV9_9MOLU|nr:hypothetical protein [Candidatus Pelethenecus faecipullorum]